ncbi:ExbD/TolR family protein [Erythrobacter donghaensis]|jgi:biopolymer transport protein ExbD|uniref:ExbD/TolR family protein n=2 Tax=Erythrobacter donghaensis TaxID=267135 RepID=UPI000A96EE8E|nr:biopolymer transporter ExbD [Erythrobacter donghaensis]
MPHALKRPNLTAPRPQPLSAMNVTPFIDVLLVLLIMLILAIPMAANVTPVDLPTDGRPKHPVLETNVLTIDAGDRLAWNGHVVTAAELRAQLAVASDLPVQPVLRFEPDAQASYDKSARTLALIREEGAQSFVFDGNEKYRDFP